MTDDEAAKLTDTMRLRKLEVVHLEFFTDETFIAAGISRALTRVKLITCIENHFKKKD